jgi:hypothetical protein
MKTAYVLAMTAILCGTIVAILHRQMPDIDPAADLESVQTAYVKLSYVEMREKLNALANLHPEVMKLSNSKEMFDIEHYIECEPKTKCVLDIVTLTDFSQPARAKT